MAAIARTAALLAMLAGATAALAQPRLGAAELMTLADSGHALALAEACGEWGDAAWFTEARRRVRLLAHFGTPSRRERAFFDGAFAMAARRGHADFALLGAIACRGVALSGARGDYDRAMADPNLDRAAPPPPDAD